MILAAKGILALVAGGQMTFAGFPMIVLFSYFLLTAIGMLNMLAAFWFERRFEWRLMLLVPFLRFGCSISRRCGRFGMP